MTADVSEGPMSDAEGSKPLDGHALAAQAELDRFIFTVSHDLKSPLVTLQGFASLLERDLLAGRTDRLVEFVQHIKGGVTQMARLIDDLLVLSRIGRVTNAAEPVDLADLSRKILRLHQAQLDQCHTDVEVQDDIPILNMDKERMADVIERLITNAIAYGCTAPHPCIRIGGSMIEGEARFFVADNGPGIVERYHQKIFDLFERLDPRTDGTGAGLAIVKRTLEVCGGRVWVESVPGQGATFWLAFPEKLVAEPAGSPTEDASR
jgi:signal transduction histidine kinase